MTTRLRPERAVLALLRGPVVTDTGDLLGSAAPKGTTFVGLEVTDGLVTVRLSSPSAPQRWRRAGTYLTAQLVFTLTEFHSIDRVRVLVNGRPCCLHLDDRQRVTEPLDRGVFRGWGGDVL